MSRWKLVKWLVNGLSFHLVINGVFWGYNPLILTFDPNFLGHPSSLPGEYLLRFSRCLDGMFLGSSRTEPQEVSMEVHGTEANYLEKP